MRFDRLARWPAAAALVLLSLLLGFGFESAGLPAGLLLGPMLAGVAVAAAGDGLRIPDPLFALAQGIVGCMIARALPLSIFSTVGAHWPLFAINVVSVVAIASALGWLLARWQVLPGTTAVWGASPGAASAMTLMAEAYGADVRLVAFMQYLRVVCVAATASMVAHGFAIRGGDVAPPAVAWAVALPAGPFAATLACAFGGAVLGRALRIPAGALLVPMLLGFALRALVEVPLVLPPWLLALGYAIVGWSIGLRFTRTIIVVALRSFPRVLLSIMLLIGLCGLLAAGLVAWADVDPLTAYLATSPGGADTVAIIAASSRVDMPFVVAMQTTRFLLVLLIGPMVARFVANRLPGAPR